MKKLCLWLIPVLLLTGCGGREDFETMSDTYEEPELLPASGVWMQLPDDAALAAMESQDGSKLYLCDGFSMAVQTFRGGDLRATLKSVTGYDQEQLLVMERRQDALKRYECVFTAAGEGGDQVGRTVVLDDGSYHYTLTLMADAASAGKLADAWQGILDSFCLAAEEPGKS